MIVNFIYEVTTQFLNVLTYFENFFHRGPKFSVEQTGVTTLYQENQTINLQNINNSILLENMINNLEINVSAAQELINEMSIELLTPVPILPFHNTSFSLLFNQLPFFRELHQYRIMTHDALFMHLKQKVILIRDGKLRFTSLVLSPLIHILTFITPAMDVMAEYFSYLEATSELLPNIPGPSSEEKHLYKTFNVLAIRYESLHEYEQRLNFFDKLVREKDAFKFDQMLHEWVDHYIDFMTKLKEFSQKVPTYGVYDKNYIIQRQNFLRNKVDEIEKIISYDIKNLGKEKI